MCMTAFMYAFISTREMTITDNNIFILFQHLYLSDNYIDSIHRFALRGLVTLFQLDVSNNRLTTAPSLVVEVKSTLCTLYLTRNYIKEINDSYFDLFENIEYINLGHNELTQLPNIQNIANTIVVFGVEFNNISNPNFVYGNEYPELRILNLESNQIAMFCPIPRHFAPQLHTLYLQSNKLSMMHFPYESDGLHATILLENNPWYCNGAMVWTQTCEIHNEAYNIMLCMERLWIRDMVCDSPLEAKGLTPLEAGNRSAKYW